MDPWIQYQYTSYKEFHTLYDFLCPLTNKEKRKQQTL